MESWRIERLDTMIAEGRLIRNKWRDDGGVNGRELACLLAALSPEAGENSDASACPASVMPAWFAYMTPWFDDSGSLEAWPGMVRRYAELARRWHVLTPGQWKKLDYRVRAIAVRESTVHFDASVFPDVAKVCVDVIALCDAAGQSGDLDLAWAARSAAPAAVDRQTSAVFDALEAEIVISEGAR